MTVFDVYMNDCRLCRAGVGRDGVLSAIVSWARLAGPALAEARRRNGPREEAQLHVGGLRDDAHLSWSDRSLKVGDRIAIVLAQSKNADQPATQKRRDANEDERREQDYYFRLKKKFEPVANAHRTRAARLDEATQFLNVDLDCGRHSGCSRWSMHSAAA